MSWLRKFLRIDDPPPIKPDLGDSPLTKEESPPIKPDLDDDEISRIWRIKEQAQRTGVGPGYFEGRWIGDYVEEVKQLRRERRFAEAEKILWGCVAAAEALAKFDHGGAPTWYSHQLLMMFREQRRYHEEIALLRRLRSQWTREVFDQLGYAKRLKRAEALLAKNPYVLPQS